MKRSMWVVFGTAVLCTLTWICWSDTLLPRPVPAHAAIPDVHSAHSGSAGIPLEQGMRSPLTTPTADLVTPGPDGHAIEDSILQALATGETCTVTLDRSQPGPWEVSCSSGAYRYAIRIERYTSPVYAQQAAASHMPAYAEQTTFHGYPAATWADREFMQDHLWQAGHWVIKTWVYDDTFSHPSAVDYSEQLYTLAQQYHLFP